MIRAWLHQLQLTIHAVLSPPRPPTIGTSAFDPICTCGRPKEWQGGMGADVWICPDCDQLGGPR